jgi:hypothetical protein
LSEQIFDSKIWRKDNSFHKSDKEKEKDNSIKNKNKNEINILTDRFNITTPLNSSYSSFNKKLPFPLHNKPLGLINKRIDNNKFNNNNINNYNNIVHNLTKFNYAKKNSDLLEKIKKKVTEEKIGTNNIKINNQDKNNKSLIKPSNDVNTEENIFNNKVEENSDKNESNEDEDILLEQKDLMDEDGPNMININKVDSIQVHSNFIREHNYNNNNNINNYSTNTHKSNKSSINLKSNTEPNNANLYMHDLPSGRSNNSGNGVFFVPPEKKNKIWEGGQYRHLYPPISSNVGYPYKGSFLSTNTNSHNQSGHKIDSSLSSESGQSPHYLSNIQSMPYNHTMNNFRSNNFYFPFAGDVTPINNRHIYTSSFKSNENLFTQRQPFSLNANSYKTKTEYNNKFSRNNFGFKVEKQIINLENVALGIETRTTVMIRNIPIKYSTIELEKELEPFEGKYNCLYMPYDYENEGNRGYAFLNLTKPLHMLLLYDFFYNKSWIFYESKKVCELNYANFQGVEEIKKHAKYYKGSKKPVFFICTKDDYINNTIEIPLKYLNLLLKANPNMKYHELNYKYTFIIDSFN